MHEYVNSKLTAQIATESWLGDNYTFDHGCNLSGNDAIRKADILLEECIVGRKRKRDMDTKHSDISILCANLLIGKRNKPLAVSLDKNRYVRNINNRASNFTRELISWMGQNGWIEYKIGYKDHKDPKESRLTRIWPSQKFLDYFGNNFQIVFNPVNLVILRDAEGNDLNNKREPKEIVNIRKVLKRANDVNNNALIQFKKGRKLLRLNTSLYAVFNHSSYKKGGRLYTGFGGYQCLSGEDRKEILINGETTVELDFAGMHPRLLYAMQGITGATLIIAKLDRLARNVAFISKLMDSGVDFVAVDFPQANRLTVHILAAVAEHEGKMISERVKVALAAAKARGTKLGSPRSNLTPDDKKQGSKLGNIAKAKQADAFAISVAPIIEQYMAEGQNLSQIAKSLNRTSVLTARGNDGAWTPQAVKNAMNRFKGVSQ